MKIKDLVGLFDSEFGDEATEELLHRVRHGLDDALKRIRRPQAALGVVKSPLGKLLVATSGHGIVLNYYIQSGSDLATTITKLRMKFDPAEDPAAVKEVADEIRGYIGGDAKALYHNVDLTLAASDFQIGVLRKLQEIPRGAVISYQALGAAVGVPTGARAVGNALHDNPVPIYVPCHRVISSDRSLGGYAGGTSSKLRLLRSEGFESWTRLKPGFTTWSGVIKRAGFTVGRTVVPRRECIQRTFSSSPIQDRLGEPVCAPASSASPPEVVGSEFRPAISIDARDSPSVLGFAAQAGALDANRFSLSGLTAFLHDLPQEWRSNDGSTV